MRTKNKPDGRRQSSTITRSEKETLRLARDMARKFRGHEVVLLIGEVCSPSFTILNIYQAKGPIFHFDLYRLEKEADILDLGWEDYLDRGVVVVEWGERLPFGLDAIRVFIAKGEGDERRITIEIPGPKA
jgi:tRNA threonylcarbamoyladenosine biosynthesis protein TsaE